MMESRGHHRGVAERRGAEVPSPTPPADLPLFMVSAPHNGTPTSRDAAADARAMAGKQRARILAHLFACGERGATAQEIESATGLAGNTVRPRLVELRESACATTSGTRKTTSGRAAQVWHAVR